jgi:hypothetical protein
MWIKSYSKVYPDIKKDDIWQLWTDVLPEQMESLVNLARSHHGR